MVRGGKREGAGRKPEGRTQLSVRVNVDDVEEMKKLISTDESVSKKAEKVFLIGLETLKNKDKDAK